MAIMVLEVTLEQKNILEGRLFCKDSYFNVVTDTDGKYFIGKEERNMCDHIKNPDIHAWIHDLPEIPHNPVIIEI